LDCQDRRKRLRDTLIALREKEEKLYAKAAEMQRELLRRDPSKAIELGGASIFEALPPLGDDFDVLREEKAEEKTKEERGVAAEAKEEEEEELTMTTATKNSEKEEQETKQNQMEEDRRNASRASASTSTRKFTSKISQTYDVHRSVLSMQFLDPSSWLDGQTSLLAASADDVIRLYASDSRKPFALMRTEKGLSCVGTTLKDRVAFCATKFGGVSQIDLATGEKIGTVVQNYEQLRVNKSIECMATSTTTGTDDNILVCAGEGSAIRVWDARCANFGAAPLTFHAPGARNVSSVALGGGDSGHTTLLASAPTSGLFAFDLRVNSSSSSPGERGGGGQISRLSVPNFEKQPRWVNAKFCAANEIFAIACGGDAATFEASGEFKATSAFAGVSAPFQMASPSSSSPFSSAASKSFVKTGGILETSADGAHVLVSTGDIGNGVQCFNTSTGAVVASWDVGSTSTSSPISCACWGHFNASAKEPFGKDAFAIADTKGSIKVFGV
jgi:WD40 repeat protein